MLYQAWVFFELGYKNELCLVSPLLSHSYRTVNLFVPQLREVYACTILEVNEVDDYKNRIALRSSESIVAFLVTELDFIYKENS